MSLDKWLKPEKKPAKKKPEKKKKKEPPQKKAEIVESRVQEKPKTLTKYMLTCPKRGCNYQKVKVKKSLTDRDKICPRCKGQMNVKQV